jgi:hypothetical protein
MEYKAPSLYLDQTNSPFIFFQIYLECYILLENFKFDCFPYIIEVNLDLVMLAALIAIFLQLLDDCGLYFFFPLVDI